LDAGLIMVGLQSIIKTVLIGETLYGEDIKKADPSYVGDSLDFRLIIELLNASLHFIFKDRVSSSYDTTFSILRYTNKMIKFCGQHESIIHWDNQMKRFNVIDTELYGLPLGSIPHLYQSLEYACFGFNTGDFLILYTDGVTESKNQDGKMLGIDGLLNILNSVSHDKLSVDYIMNKINIWNGYGTFDDDLTLVMVKNI